MFNTLQKKHSIRDGRKLQTIMTTVKMTFKHYLSVVLEHVGRFVPSIRNGILQVKGGNDFHLYHDDLETTENTRELE